MRHLILYLSVVVLVSVAACGDDVEEDQSVTDLNAADTGGGLLDTLLCGFGGLCHCPPEPDVPDQQTLHDEEQFNSGGPWNVAETGGLDDTGYHWAMANHGASGTWLIPLSEEGRYQVFAYIPKHDETGIASYEINTCSHSTPVEVDQAVTESGWVEIGEFDLEPGAEVRLRSETGSVFVADALEVTRIP